jgi:hypothetical protein
MNRRTAPLGREFAAFAERVTTNIRIDPLAGLSLPNDGTRS